jgi:hypothetical protein
MRRHHGADGVGHEHGAPTGLGLGRGQDVAAANAPCQPLGDRHPPPSSSIRPTRRAATSDQRRPSGADPDHGPVTLRQLGRDAPDVFGRQVVAAGAVDGGQHDVAARCPGQTVVAHGNRIWPAAPHSCASPCAGPGRSASRSPAAGHRWEPPGRSAAHRCPEARAGAVSTPPGRSWTRACRGSRRPIPRRAHAPGAARRTHSPSGGECATNNT